MENLKGLIVNIYRHENYKAGTINKLESFNSVVLVDKKVGTVFNATEEMPPIRIVTRQINGSEYLHAEPYEAGSYAFGGSFIYTSDERFREFSKYPIPLHDRQMNLEARI